MRFAERVHDVVLKTVLTEFRPRFAADGRVVWMCEDELPPAYASREVPRLMRRSQAEANELPNVIVFEKSRNRTYLIDVARLGRQITIERRDALLRMLHGQASEIVFVNAFLNRKEFQRLVHAFAWETVAWFAEEPDHMIHFNSPRRGP